MKTPKSKAWLQTRPGEVLEDSSSFYGAVIVSETEDTLWVFPRADLQESSIRFRKIHGRWVRTG